MRNVSRILMALALLFVAASANAQNSILVRATVPFTFEVAGQVMPAGDYRFSLNLTNGLVMISDQIGNSVSFLSSYEGQLEDGRSSLQFGEDGNARHLLQITFAGAAQQVPQAARKQAARANEIASKGQLALVQ